MQQKQLAQEDQRRKDKQQEGMKTFVLSDESLNSQGFRVMTAGIDLEQFKKNPVMLYSHDPEVLPIGRWENVRVDGDKLLADAVFDEHDEFAQKVAKKVADEIVRCCSIGFRVLEWSEDPALMLPGQRYDTVTKAQLMECSICAIGANQNAMALYDAHGKKVELSDDALVALGFTKVAKPGQEPGSNNEQQKDMDKKNEEFQQQNSTLLAENEQLKAEVKQLRDAAAKHHQAHIESVVSGAVADGRIDASEKEKWARLMGADAETAEQVLAAMPKRTSLSALVAPGGGKSQYDGKSWADLDKAGELSAYKAQNPEGFKALYKQTFGVDYVE